MDVGQIGELRAWATRLEERGESDELRAAARAILMLAEEVEDLQVRLEVASSAEPSSAEGAGQAAEAEPAWAEVRRRETEASFLSRIKRTFGLD